MSWDKSRWEEVNQRYLIAALADVRTCLEQHAAKQGLAAETHLSDQKPSPAELSELTTPPALERLAESFTLSRFETSILLLCAGVELDASFAALVAKLQKPGHPCQPSFSL